MEIVHRYVMSDTRIQQCCRCMEIVHRYVMSDTRTQQCCRCMENVHRYVMSDTRIQQWQCCRYISQMRYVTGMEKAAGIRVEVANARMLKRWVSERI